MKKLISIILSGLAMAVGVFLVVNMTYLQYRTLFDISNFGNDILVCLFMVAVCGLLALWEKVKMKFGKVRNGG